MSNFIYMDDGSLMVAGWNMYGQLGIGNKEDQSEYVQMMKDPLIESITGSSHVLYKKENGDVYGFGSNAYGQLGFPKETESFVIPTIIFSDQKVKIVSCGTSHTLIYKENGQLFGFGANYFGQLGKVDPKNIYTPTLLLRDKEIKEIQSGSHHNLILKYDGTVLFFGQSSYGQSTKGVENVHQITEIMKDKNIKNIFCGGWSCFFYKYSGELLACGANESGQLGLGIKERSYLVEPALLIIDQDITSLKLGISHVLMLKKKWGVVGIWR
eukprot:TRINITY_DN1284_c0_g6_i1.p1 TRINITY_DN1284_c0_g6~~TRINITY_DN1284_c0_g6_i1.p1  ORF type:complete len:269 (-),score=55.14 TRINITY_DN1284_c0_g6_i1:323-1129(-)